MLVVSLLLLAMVSETGFATNGDCEPDLLPRAKAMAKLVELGLKYRELSSEDLEGIVKSPELIDPYELHGRQIENLSFKTRFAREFGLATVEEKAQARRAILGAFEVHHKQEKLVAVAREETAQIISPKFLRTLKIKGFEGKKSEYSLTWMEGRPIFVGRVNVKNSNQLMTAIFDPFHPKVSERAHTIKTNDSYGNPDWKFQFFERDGIPYAVDFKQNIYVDLKSKTHVTQAKFHSKHRTHHFTVKNSAVVLGKNGSAHAIATMDFDRYQDQIIKFDLRKPGKFPEILADNVKIMKRAPVTHYAGTKTFVTYCSDKLIYIYDATNDKMLEPLDARMDGYDENRALIFEDKGRHYLAYLELTPNNLKYVLHVRDLESGEVKTSRYRFDSPDPSEYRVIDGVPHLYFFDDTQLILVNLRTRVADRTPVPDRNTSSAFSWKGREFLTWAVDERTLTIYELGTRGLVASAPVLPEGVHQIITVPFKGHIYAFAAVHNDMPVLLRLTHGGGEKVEP